MKFPIVNRKFHGYIQRMDIVRLKSDTISELLDDVPAVCLIGPRQCGKTTLARELATLRGESIYVDMESPRDVAKLTEPEMFFEENAHQLVILDEIQRKPELFSVLRSVIDRDRRPGRFLLTGSASPELLQRSSETLAGRLAIEELSPFHWLEVSDRFNLNHVWMHGGFPDALLARTEKMSRRWRVDFVRTYLERELPLLGLQTKADKLRAFVSMLMHTQGQLMNRENLARALGTSGDTVLKYLEFLEYAFFIRQLKPYFTNIGKRLVKSPKVYIRDSGLLHAIAGMYELTDILGHPLAGGSWEGFVIEQISTLLDSDIEPMFYRTHQGAEADLVLVKNQKPIAAMEIKLTDSPKRSRGFLSVMDDLKTPHNWIVIPGKDRFPMGDGVEAIGLERLLAELKDGTLL